MPRALESVPGPSAAQWDLRRRLAWLAALLVLLVAAVLGATGVVTGLLLAIPVALAALVVSWVLGARCSRAMAAEKQAGYSTMFDFAGYELRHPVTLELLRDRDTAPDRAGRRSLISGMLKVKPGTVLARRLDDEG